MGCSASRMEQEDGAAAAAADRSSAGNAAAEAGIWPIRQVIGEVRRRTGGGPRVRKDSIVSAAEVLLPVDPDATSDLDESISGKPNPKTAEEDGGGGKGKRSAIYQVDRAGDGDEEETVLPSPEVEKKQGEEEDLAAVEEEAAAPAVELAAAVAVEEEVAPAPAMGRWEDLPASPSFRIYYVPRDSDEESVAVPWMNGTNKIQEEEKQEEEEEEEREKEEVEEQGDERDEKKRRETEEKLPQEEKSCDSNACEFQPMKKADNREEKEEQHKGRRLKALWKAPYRVYRLFNVRNCYHQNGDAAAGGSSAPSTSAAAPSIGRIHADPDAAA